MDKKQQELMSRLQELQKYEQQQENAAQKPPVALLTREQLHMYEMLGLSVSNYEELPSTAEPLNVESENENDFEEIQAGDPDEPILSSSDESSHIVEYNNELVKSPEVVASQESSRDIPDVDQVPKKPFLKRGAGLTSRFRVSPDAFNLKNLPPYKYAERVRKNLPQKPPSKAKVVEKPATKKKVEVEEKKSESMDLVAPAKVALKPPPEPSTSGSKPNIQEWFDSRPKKPLPQVLDTPKNFKLPKGVSWAQILKSNPVTDSPMENLLTPQEEEGLDETSLFQLLEEKINKMNVDTSMTSLMQLISNLQKQSSSEDQTMVNPEDPIIPDPSTVNVQLQPHPSDVNKKIIIDDSTEDDEELDEHRVRFAEDIEVVQEDSDLSTDLEAMELSQTSTPREQEKFKNFKRNLLGGKTEHSELREKSDQLKTKLEELEDEINSLRQQSAEVERQRRELDLDRIQLENDREDMMELMKDEKIKMELQLHDERVKLEQEKQKAIKIPQKKEREEMAKLKETIEDLKEELKTKEVRHGSASARYRSQIKQLEKENQSLKLELEVVKKDNRKLELENARLRKDTNNKMLQEINRNIAKLAPQPEVTAQPEVVKKPPMRRSDPVVKKRLKNVLEPKPTISSTDSSDDDIPPAQYRKSSKENNPVRTRRSDPPRASSTTSKTSSEMLEEMKREIVNPDGSKDIWYPDGNLKKISPDGMLVRMLYFNKDIKEKNITEGTTKYYYNETNTWHTTYIDGLEILEHPDGQIEHRYKDGTNEIHYLNGSIRITNTSWNDDTKEEWRLPDGTNIKIKSNETRILSFPNGQREIHTSNHKRREYPDGTVKLAYQDGTLETRYSNGRVRIKDNKGNLISDTMSSS